MHLDRHWVEPLIRLQHAVLKAMDAAKYDNEIMDEVARQKVLLTICRASSRILEQSATYFQAQQAVPINIQLNLPIKVKYHGG